LYAGKEIQAKREIVLRWQRNLSDEMFNASLLYRFFASGAQLCLFSCYLILYPDAS
jgi:hypothetical protein